METKIENNYYVRRTIITPAGKSVGEAGPMTKEKAEQLAEEETYTMGLVEQYCEIVQH